MPVDSSGNITRPSSPIPVTGQTADAPQVNVAVDDMINSMNMLMFLDGRKPLRGNIPMNGYRARGAADAEQPQDYVTLAQLQSLIGESGVPTGTVQSYTLSSATPPAGWVFANGQSLSRATFPRLWAAVQAGNNLAASEGSKQTGQYGPGNGSTTFTVPDLTIDNGLFIRSTRSGRGIGTAQSGAIQSHTHTGTTSTGGAHTHAYRWRLILSALGGSPNISGVWSGGDSPSGETFSSGNHNHTFTTDAAGAEETRPNNVAYPFIIKS